MAWHCEEAGLSEKAAVYYLHAGRRASLLSYAGEESISQYNKALRLLAALPESLRRARYECRCQIGLGMAWAAKSHLSPGIGQAFRRAVELAQCLGDANLLAGTLACLASDRRQHGEIQEALSLNERAVSAAQGGPPGLMFQLEGELAQTLLLHGSFAPSARLRESVSNRLASMGSVRVGRFINHLAHVPWALWCLGYPDRALQACQRALEMVLRDQGKLAVGAEVMVYTDAICFIHQLCRKVEGVEQGLQVLLRSVEARRCEPVMVAFAKLYLDWVQVERGHLEQGIETLRSGVAEWSERFMVLRPYWKGYLAQALAHAGHVDEGLAMVEEALQQVGHTQEGFAEAELYRLKGELLLQRGHEAGEAEFYFRHAVKIACTQQAKSWELRATVSLARLLREQGRQVEGHKKLAAIYARFTEGFDTPDLQEAAALLQTLR